MLAVRKTNNPIHRQGFTMVELMIVIVIIAILAALILPAVQRAVITTRNTGVKNEIGQLESAIASFKATHGIEPPSLINLYEQGTINAAATAGWNVDATSRSLIRQMWPQYNFAVDIDINGDGKIAPATTPITLAVSECLVFFLGGMNGNTNPGSTTAANNNVSNIGACTGFSKDVTSPFTRGGVREAPLFEFIPARFTDLNGNGFPEYKDTLPSQKNPYLYYSSYEGSGYQEGTEFISGNSSAIGLYYAYRQPTSSGVPTWNLADPFWKPNSFQIISPGYDTKYGYGGDYLSTGTIRLPFPTSGAPTAAQRAPEADNITNFAQGVLQP